MKRKLHVFFLLVFLLHLIFPFHTHTRARTHARTHKDCIFYYKFSEINCILCVSVLQNHGSVIFPIFWWILTTTANIIRNDDICGSYNGRRLYLELDERSILYAKDVTFVRNLSRQLVPRPYATTINSLHHHCSLELVTCPSCVIVLTFKNIALPNNCGDGGIVMDSPCRCDYVWLSEPPYEEVSGTPFCGLYAPITYRSSTRTLSITLLYSQSHKHAFTIEYTAKRNRLHLKGTEMTSRVSTKGLNSTGGGILMSPFFPARYPRDLSLEYIITCPSEALSCRIRLLFSDFQLATVSIIEYLLISQELLSGNTELIIKEGPTSALTSLEVIRHPTNQLQPLIHREHIAPVINGFHVSLRGTFSPSSHLAIAYAAFNYMDCFAGTDFLCQNHRCIPSKLNCDGFDHCGDNSDEPATCFQNWEMEPRDRKWHMNKANYYFPKIDRYPDLKTATLIFVASSLGLIVLISALIILLYRIGARARQQRELQSRLETISELLDGARIDEISIPDDPPGYEAPPDYEEVAKLALSKKTQCLKCDRTFNRNFSNQHENANSSTYLVMEGSSDDRSNQTTPITSENNQRALRIPESPPPPYITPPGTILRNIANLSTSMKQICPIRLRCSAQYPQASSGNHTLSPCNTLHCSSKKFSYDNCVNKISTINNCCDKLQDNFEIASETASSVGHISPRTRANTLNDTPKRMSCITQNHRLRHSDRRHSSCDVDSLYEGIKILDSYLARRSSNINHEHRHSVTVILFGTPKHGPTCSLIASLEQTRRERYIRARTWRSNENVPSN
ncbi:hypothetical protein ALC56_13843 [Trachymyrmex septentrionalis]|uniref:CUB domain-containing protein n=1 Tax=Trachymyrmex septentrionalis TaxID=34720 RepID=A0A195EUZ4_9HYME|nr:hypothetical protein ALC56_13843 [Trachymyrmex septentrionalis]